MASGTDTGSFDVAGVVRAAEPTLVCSNSSATDLTGSRSDVGVRKSMLVDSESCAVDSRSCGGDTSRWNHGSDGSHGHGDGHVGDD